MNFFSFGFLHLGKLVKSVAEAFALASVNYIIQKQKQHS
jgi:hypothetical protein